MPAARSGAGGARRSAGEAAGPGRSADDENLVRRPPRHSLTARSRDDDGGDAAELILLRLPVIGTLDTEFANREIARQIEPADILAAKDLEADSAAASCLRASPKSQSRSAWILGRSAALSG